MADKSIKITIATALNAAGFTAARRAISNLVSGTKDFAKKVGGNLMNIKAGFDLVSAAASKLMQVMSKGMEFERMTVTFKSLTGSMELAKAHMKDLQDLGRTPPFSLETFAAASQMLMKMTDGMLGYKKSLEMVGDIAAATGNDISQVGRSVGLAYQMIRDGQPFGRAGSQMVQLGILTKAQVEHFDELSKSGGNNMAVWEELTKVLSKYKGAMAETEKTAKGVVEAIQGEATVAITDFSAAITESAKPALEGLLGYMKRINEDGTIEEWADASVENLNMVASAMKGLGSIVSSIWTGIKATIGTAMAFGAGADEEWRNGGKSLNMWSGLKNQVKAGYSVAKEYWRSEVYGSNDDEENRQLTRKDRAEAKAKMRDAERAKTEAEAEKRIRDDMARAQAETTAKFEKARQDAIDETIAKLKAAKAADLFGVGQTIQESVKQDLSTVDKAIASLSKARTEEELKAAKAAVEALTQKQKAEDDAFKKAQDRARESDRNATEFVNAYEKDKEETAKKAAKAELEANRDAMKKLHDERMKQLDAEQAKVQKNIDAAKAKGFDSLMATAGGGYYGNGTLDQGNEERERRQRVIGAQRAADAEMKLREKMLKTGATLDDPTKLGRMSNLERAAFERLKLKEAEQKAAKIQNEKDAREKKMSEDLDAINKKLKEVGL